MAGYVGSVYGWKYPLLIVSLPNVIMAAFVYFTCIDPPRGILAVCIYSMHINTVYVYTVHTYITNKIYVIDIDL